MSGTRRACAALMAVAWAVLVARPALAENVDKTVRARTRTIKVIPRPDEGQIDLVIGGTTYRYFIRSGDPAALPAATSARLAEIRASSLLEIESIPYGDYRKVTKLSFVAGTEAEAASAEKALPKPYNGCALKKTLAASATAREAYDLASAEARAWQADSALHEMQTTRDAPLDPQGRSSSWAFLFFSSSASAINSIKVAGGAMHCFAHPSNALHTIDVGPDVILDTKRIYAAAQEAGGSEYTAEGYTVSAGLPSDHRGGAAWHVSYEPPGGMGGDKSFIIDARTGVVR